MSDEILDEFKEESKALTEQMIEVLEEIEGDFSQVSRLNDYGGLIDRIMGGAKSLALSYPTEHSIHRIAAYAEICKIVGYRGAQIQDNAEFFNICVALLLDATEMLDKMLDRISDIPNQGIQSLLTTTFLDRLHWVNSKFSETTRASVDFKKTHHSEAPLAQDGIDELLKSLGIG